MIKLREVIVYFLFAAIIGWLTLIVYCKQAEAEQPQWYTNYLYGQGQRSLYLPQVSVPHPLLSYGIPELSTKKRFGLVPHTLLRRPIYRINRHPVREGIRRYSPHFIPVPIQNRVSHPAPVFLDCLPLFNGVLPSELLVFENICNFYWRQAYGP